MQQGSVQRKARIGALASMMMFSRELVVAMVLMGGILASFLTLVRGARVADAADGQTPTAGQSAADSAGKGDAVPAVGSGSSAQKETADSREIGLLIHQLGDPAYSVRQRATKRLIELGIVTQPLLIQALDDDDAEVRSRAGQVLGQVVEADFHFRLEAFANDLEGRQQHTLPFWGRFSQVFGQDKVSRMLFVEMQRAEPALLEALDTNPKLAGELFVMRMQSIIQSLQLPLRDGNGHPTIALGTICDLLLVSAADGVTISDQDAMQLFNLAQQPTSMFRSALGTHPGSGILKKMLGAWMVHNSTSALAHQNLTVAFTYDLREGLDLALKLLGSDGGPQQPAILHDALITVGRFGNHEHIALIEPWLKDTSSCLTPPANDPRQPQIRDVALAVLIHLSGQELKDYGLDQVQLNFQTLPPCGTIAFPDSLTRKVALRKWEQWAGRAGVNPADKSDSKTEASSQTSDRRLPTSPTPVAAAAPGTAALSTQGPGLPAAKAVEPTAPRPAELEQ